MMDGTDGIPLGKKIQPLAGMPSLDESRKRRRATSLRAAAGNAIKSERYLAAIFWLDHTQPQPLQIAFHATDFPFGDFPNIQGKFRDFLSGELRKRDAPPAEEQEADDEEPAQD